MRWRITWTDVERPWWGLGLVRREVHTTALTPPGWSGDEVATLCVILLDTGCTEATFRPEAS